MTNARSQSQPIDAAGQTLSARFPLIAAMVTTRLEETLRGAAIVMFVINAAVLAFQLFGSAGIVTLDGVVKGGDFAVFKLAGEMVRQGNFLSAFADGVIPARLQALYPDADSNFLLYWQYPPTMFVFVAVLGFLPYFAGYALWSGGSAALYFSTLRAGWKNALALALIIASPVTLQAIVTGQTGFLTATLIFAAALFADKRPVIAGIAAGLLTIKPQLGILIPFAYAAAGCRRAFIIAAATAITLALISTFAFGADSWAAFFDALREQGARLNSSIFPFRKLVSPFGALSYFGAPANAAMAAQIGITLGLAGFVAIVWRRCKAPEIRVATLLAAAPLASPYSFYYELTIIAPAALMIAKLGMEKGWLPHERQALALAYALCLFIPGDPETMGLPAPFLVAALVFAIVARRALSAVGVRFSSGTRPAQSAT